MREKSDSTVVYFDIQWKSFQLVSMLTIFILRIFSFSSPFGPSVPCYFSLFEQIADRRMFYCASHMYHLDGILCDIHHIGRSFPMKWVNFCHATATTHFDA